MFNNIFFAKLRYFSIIKGVYGLNISNIYNSVGGEVEIYSSTLSLLYCGVTFILKRMAAIIAITVPNE